MFVMNDIIVISDNDIYLNIMGLNRDSIIKKKYFFNTYIFKSLN